MDIPIRGLNISITELGSSNIMKYDLKVDIVVC